MVITKSQDSSIFFCQYTLDYKHSLVSFFKWCICPYFSQTVLEQGGLSPGGLNFDCKVRRESTELRDMFISHIGT